MLGNETGSTDDDIIPDVRVPQDNGPHAHQAVIAYAPAMDDGTMTDSDPISYDSGLIPHDMDDGIILHIGALADDDGLEVPPHHGTEPDARIITDSHISCHGGCGSYKDILAQFRHDGVVR